MTLTLKVDADAAYNAVLQQKQVPYAMNLAMNSWMFSTNKFLKNKIDNYLEGGAELYTKSGFRVDRVKNKRDLRGKPVRQFTAQQALFRPLLLKEHHRRRQDPTSESDSQETDAASQRQGKAEC
jgi:hypothetical protein